MSSAGPPPAVVMVEASKWALIIARAVVSSIVTPVSMEAYWWPTPSTLPTFIASGPPARGGARRALDVRLPTE